MARPIEFRTKRAYESRMGLKANKNLEIMAVVGDGGGVASVPNRDSFYWIRLVGDDDRLTQCFCNICALSDGDLIYVARAKDEKLSYYEFVRFIQNADADTTDPPVCPKFAQVVYVSENSCQFNTVGAAVTYINALVTGPAAGRLFLIKCQAGNFAEAGDVTIPQYVHLEGVGEASELEMGVNALILSDDTSVFHIVVESSDPTDAIRMNGVSNVVLRNVRGIQGAAADCFHVYGASLGIELYNCIAEATVGNAVGFHVGDTADVLMEDSKAEDSTNFADALLLDATLCAVVSRRCTFVGNGDDVHTGANSVWYHFDCHFYLTNCTLAAGTHYAEPSKRFNQTLVVAEQGGDFQALSEAITYINAQGDAAAGKRYGIRVLAGNFAEAGNVTIPPYVDVAGMGENSRIEMGANQFDFDDYSSALDIVVTSSHNTACLIIGGETDVELRNVKVIALGSGHCFVISTSTFVALYDCIAEAPAAAAQGFRISGTASDIMLEGCTADTTNLTFAMYVTNTASVTTKFCTFRGTVDVEVGATAEWIYHEDNFDPDNCTISGVAEPNAGQSVVYWPVTRTAGAAGDFATVQAAIDWFKNRLLCALCKIDIVTGASYAETLVIEDVFCAAEGRLELEGDTRGMAGATWVDGAAITCQDANAGSGVCTLANAGAVITVTGAGGNPDFDADGWANGDTVITRDNAGAIATYTISATLNNTITLTVAAPALGNTGTSLTLVPDTVIAPAGAGNGVEVIESRGILLDGLHLDATAGATGHSLYVHDGGGCACENVLAEADDDGFLAEWGTFIKADDGACTAIECNVGFWALNGARVLADYGVAVGCGAAGFYGGYMGICEADYAVATDCVLGFTGQWLGGVNCKYAYALQNTSYGFRASRQGFNRCNDSRTLGTNGTDYRSDYNSYMFATNTNVGGPTYSPAVSDTEGNVFGIITFS